VGFSTNKKLSRGNATIDRRSVGVDGIGSHWFVERQGEVTLEDILKDMLKRRRPACCAEVRNA
jgi:hypothetical protein